MEATSDYWKPPFYLLEAAGFEQVWLVNARDVKHLPGRGEDRQARRGVAVQGRRAGHAAPEFRAAHTDPAAA
jgi:transposase